MATLDNFLSEKHQRLTKSKFSEKKRSDIFISVRNLIRVHIKVKVQELGEPWRTVEAHIGGVGAQNGAPEGL
jgi:hypothetical protein